MKANPNAGFKKQINGGNELTMDEYTSYISALRVQPFLTAAEAADLFNIGIARVQEMMNEPDCKFITRAISPRRRLIHREMFEVYLMTYDVSKKGEAQANV